MTRKSTATASTDRRSPVDLIDAALAAAKEIGIPAAAVNATGNRPAFDRTDDAPVLAVDVGIDKAWGAAPFVSPTHVWNDYVSSYRKVAPPAYPPPMVAVAVGSDYPILEDGRLIAGVRIWGGNHQQDQGLHGGLGDAGFEVPGMIEHTEAASRRRVAGATQ